MKEKLEKLIIEGESFLGKNKTSDDESFQSWNNALIRLSEKYYGRDTTTTNNFKERSYSLSVYTIGTPDKYFISAFERDLKITLEDLKRLLEEIDDEVVTFIPLEENKGKKSKDLQPIHVNVTNMNNNNNTNVNSNSLSVMSFQEIHDQLEDNTYLDDDAKKELIAKLTEIKKIHNSNESKSKKWSKAKTILAFILDKGADIAKMFIPKILEAIK